MAGKKRGLSKGLESLLAGRAISSVASSNETEATGKTTDVGAATVEPGSAVASESSGASRLVSQLRPGRFQPRKTIPEEELEPLAESIKQQGILQPIVVRETKKGAYEILAGERRWRAAQKAGLREVPVIIKDVSDQDALAIGIIENIQRENLNALEEAKALERLCKDFGLSHQDAAKLVGKSRTVVTNLLRILNLRPEVKMMLERGEIDLGHAKVLLGLDGKHQVSAAQEVVTKQLSVRETEVLVANYQKDSKKPVSGGSAPMDPDIRRLQLSLSEKVGAKVNIHHNAKGRGKIEIKYSSLDELEGILDHIQ